MFSFVSILNHHLLRNVDIISHWKVWETDHVYKGVSLFLKSVWIKVWNPHEEKKKSSRIFSRRRFHFIASDDNVKWALQIQTHTFLVIVLFLRQIGYFLLIHCFPEALLTVSLLTLNGMKSGHLFPLVFNLMYLENCSSHLSPVRILLEH